ncbi:MAG: polyribonucleotide nucleotidyltransferase [Limnochordia bacterium]|jgi:polyribonucleotide nucleotidyltransferase|nr:polyribonucleotide nucleotidyltransferase [Limnochordia bacterium]MDI9464890.1 polyribonucleotide nucleotidyltransferase [Bacillota bacterium]NLO95221.1 polyribonucleotide nucleotidyltransferase [Bacillota bacterium]HAN94542.1 polyribonucleotide nucleotidyltransferase [Bacillota bacterium]HOB39906.1 polyribonucleotide nucleotidyltransferase [Limnochordia bacterium]
MQTEFRRELAGRPLVLEFGGVAKQANGSVLVRYGETVVLVTATMSKEPRTGIDFFPLLVDYEERQYAVGRIPGGWGRREGRPSEEAILSARMIDRPLRPLFPEGFRNDVHIVATVMSVDKSNSPTIAALIGASAALHVSDIPFGGPVGGVKVGRVNGRFVLNPTLAEQAESDLEITIAGTKDAVTMVEAGANEVPEQAILEAISFGHQFIKELCLWQEEIRAQIGKGKAEVTVFQPALDLDRWVREHVYEELVQALKASEKLERERLLDEVRGGAHEAYQEEFGEEEYEEQSKFIDAVFDAVLKEEVRRAITQDRMRPDGRRPEEIRPVTCQVGLLPRAHGSGLFTRGQTQVLTSVTLGLKSDEQLLDSLTDEESKRYIHHYNFPPYSVGEVRPIRGPGRREIGHGALAERALLPMIPKEEEFPYTIRLVSEVLESNGSSSMASVCGSTLALMDAGVPIKQPVAGIAMGLVMMDGKYTILTDIQGLEDALGDMDFKVAGTSRGITALQMDIKISGVTQLIMAEALEQARKARLFILDKMLAVIPKPRPDLSKYAPRIITMEIPVDKIRDVIGPGGKIIRDIIAKTGVEIDIEDDGRVYIASTDEEGGKKAQQLIERYVKDVEVGETYLGVVKRIMNFGAFVEILPGKEGLVHISQLENRRVKRVEDVLKVGDEVLVKVLEIDRQGRINLSRKEALAEEKEFKG